MKIFDKNIIPKEIILLNDIFVQNNGKLFLVGGCVRDFLLNKKIKDFDICTDLLPDQIISILSKNNIEFRQEGKHFGIIVAIFKKKEFEIATFRTDLNDTEDRNTNVKVGVTIEEDVQQRDFTINSLFANIETGEIIDLVGGIQDLENKILRANGDPIQRFKEDGLRMLRAVRFASKLDLTLSDDLEQALNNEECIRSLKKITRPRIVNEFTNAFNSCKRKSLLQFHLNSSMKKVIFPNLILEGNTGIIPEEDLFKFKWIEMFIVRLLNEQQTVTSVAKKLIENGFDSKTSHGVELIMNISKKGLSNIDIVKLTRDIKKTNLTFEILNIIFEVSFFTEISDIVKKVTTKICSLNKFKDQELGNEISKECEKEFKNLLLNILIEKSIIFN